MAPFVNWTDQQLTEPPGLSSPKTNGSHAAHRLNRIEMRVKRMEHYVHGRGWITRLVAWIGLAIAVTVGFAVQQHRIDELQQHTHPA